MRPIPISAAEQIAKKYGYDQVVIIARAVGEGEHVTTYGRDKPNCDVAARTGDFLKFIACDSAESRLSSGNTASTSSLEIVSPRRTSHDHANAEDGCRRKNSRCLLW